MADLLFLTCLACWFPALWVALRGRCHHGWMGVSDIFCSLSLGASHAPMWMTSILAAIGAFYLWLWWHHRGIKHKIEKAIGVVVDIGHRLVVRPVSA